MKVVLIRYNEKGELTKTVTVPGIKITEQRFRRVTINKNNELDHVLLDLKKGDDMNECIKMLHMTPEDIRRIMMKNEHELIYQSGVTDIDIKPLIDKLIGELPKVYK